MTPLLRLLLAGILVGPLFAGAEVPRPCQYAGATYPDGTLKTHEATCAECGDGTWVDKDDSFCKNTKPASPLADAPPLAGRHCVGADGKVYSDGSFRRNAANCQRCNLTKWVDKAESYCKKEVSK